MLILAQVSLMKTMNADRDRLDELAIAMACGRHQTDHVHLQHAFLNLPLAAKKTRQHSGVDLDLLIIDHA